MQTKEHCTMKRTDYINWDEYFMGIALLTAMRSKDPSSQVDVYKRQPFSTAGKKFLGTLPPNTFSSKTTCSLSQGSKLMMTSPNWPWPPVCFLWRPCFWPVLSLIHIWWDPVAAGNRAGDGMARFTCVGMTGQPPPAYVLSLIHI